jgi:tRNA modification GTPase
MILNPQDTIYALSTSLYGGAIAMIRLSGPESHHIVQQFFRGKELESQKSYTLQFGKIVSGETLIDEVLLSIFRSPHSYTGEDMVEISCHASPFIVQRILELSHLNGARMAQPGEFSMRAFGNGKMDLSQAEAVADLISSQSSASHKVAINQLRGGISNELSALREKLINFASLIELELAEKIVRNGNNISLKMNLEEEI